jgi:putative ABC transport system permease protein
MFKSNLKLALRYIAKHKISSAINIFGLSIGLASCLLIALYINHEISYDNFQVNRDRIVRVIMEYSLDGSNASNIGNFTSVRVGPVLTQTFPEVESALIMTNAERVVKYQDKMLSEKNFMYADSNFFDVFTFHLLQGDPHRVIAGPNQVVVTESTAKKYFGNEHAVGKLLHVGNDSSLYQVTGVMQDCPSNSQIKFDFLASFSSLGITKDYYTT